MYRLETLVCTCVGRRGLAIIEAKLTVLQVRRVKPKKGKRFNHRNVVADLGLGPRAPNPGLSSSHLLQVYL